MRNSGESPKPLTLTFAFSHTAPPENVRGDYLDHPCLIVKVLNKSFSLVSPKTFPPRRLEHQDVMQMCRWAAMTQLLHTLPRALFHTHCNYIRQKQRTKLCEATIIVAQRPQCFYFSFAGSKCFSVYIRHCLLCWDHLCNYDYSRSVSRLLWRRADAIMVYCITCCSASLRHLLKTKRKSKLYVDGASILWGESGSPQLVRWSMLRWRRKLEMRSVGLFWTLCAVWWLWVKQPCDYVVSWCWVPSVCPSVTPHGRRDS